MATFIDAKTIIASKNPKLAQRLPQPVIRWFEKIIHQDDINSFLKEHEDSDAFTFCKEVINEFNVNLKHTGLANISEGVEPCLLVANHPLGGLDAIALIHLLKEQFPNLTFIVNDLLLAITNLQKHFVGVNKLGKTANQSLQKIEKLFASNTPVCLFPSGLVSRKVHGKVRDLEWKKTFVRKAIHYNKAIIPIHIDGELSNRFYQLAYLRRLTRIGFNIEMLFLVDEFYRLKNTTINVTVGKPIPSETFTSDKSYHDWAQWVKTEVYKLNTGI